MDLDDELRQLFSSGRPDIPVRPDAEDVIVAGARRLRRRRIAAATAGGALAVVIAVAAGFVLADGDPDAMPPATATSTTRPAASSAEVTTQSSRSSSTASAAGTTTPSPSTPPPPSTPTGTSEPPPPELDVEVVGPTGLRAIQLGQTLAEAQATGLLGAPIYDAEGGCRGFQLLTDAPVRASVYISDTVQYIYANSARTPEGVAAGWTVEQVKAVYPDLDELAAANGNALVAVPGNPGAQFRLWFDGGVVDAVSLQFVDQACWG